MLYTLHLVCIFNMYNVLKLEVLKWMKGTTFQTKTNKYFLIMKPDSFNW